MPTLYRYTGQLITLLVATLAISFAMGCSTPMITLESSPSNAEIYLSQYGNGDAKRIGETPFSSSVTDLKKQYGVGGPMTLEFRKEGYFPYRAVVTDITATDLTVSGELAAVSGIDEQAKLNRIIDQIFESQSLARAGRHEDALLKLRALEKDAPQIAAIYELEGGIYYLQKKFAPAFDAYTRAAKLNPGNAQSVAMRNLLRSALDSDREPAAGKAGSR